MKHKVIKGLIDNFNANSIYLPLNKIELEQVIDILFSQMFPICEKLDVEKSEVILTQAYTTVLKNISNLIDEDNARNILETFFNKLPAIQLTLIKDASAFLNNDPAATSIEEVILAYPGFFALTVHRIAHEFYKMEVPIIPRLFSEYAHTKTGIDIHPGASIGNNFFLDHGTGIVIGETCIIGNNVKIYQGVTLGALYVTKDLAQQKRHPTVEDNVVIYAGATILGGDTIIGHDCTIGGNVWITQSILPYTLVYYNSEMKIKTIKDFKDPINYVI